MDRLTTMEVFVRVVEERLGVSLLLRSSRGVGPTEAGQNFYERAQRAIEEADEAEHAAREAEHAARDAANGLTGRPDGPPHQRESACLRRLRRGSATPANSRGNPPVARAISRPT